MGNINLNNTVENWKFIKCISIPWLYCSSTFHFSIDFWWLDRACAFSLSYFGSAARTLHLLKYQFAFVWFGTVQMFYESWPHKKCFNWFEHQQYRPISIHVSSCVWMCISLTKNQREKKNANNHITLLFLSDSGIFEICSLEMSVKCSVDWNSLEKAHRFQLKTSMHQRCKRKIMLVKRLP